MVITNRLQELINRTVILPPVRTTPAPDNNPEEPGLLSLFQEALSKYVLGGFRQGRSVVGDKCKLETEDRSSVMRSLHVAASMLELVRAAEMKGSVPRMEEICAALSNVEGDNVSDMVKEIVFDAALDLWLVEDVASYQLSYC